MNRLPYTQKYTPLHCFFCNFTGWGSCDFFFLFLKELHEPEVKSSIESNFVPLGSPVSLSCLSSKDASIMNKIEYHWLNQDNEIVSNQSTLTIESPENSTHAPLQYRCQTSLEDVVLFSKPFQVFFSCKYIALFPGHNGVKQLKRQ